MIVVDRQFRDKSSSYKHNPSLRTAFSAVTEMSGDKGSPCVGAVAISRGQGKTRLPTRPKLSIDNFELSRCQHMQFGD